jgi:hypothetical protein
LGRPPFQAERYSRVINQFIGGLNISGADQRNLLRNWVVSWGIESSAVRALSKFTLEACYNFDRALDRVRANPHQSLLPDDTLFDVSFDHAPVPETVPATQPEAPEMPVETVPNVEPPAKADDDQRFLDELRERLTRRQLDEDRVVQLIHEHTKPQTIVKTKVIVQKLDLTKHFLPEDEPRHAIFEDVLIAILAKRNVFLVGPAGCGKSHLVGQVARAAGLGFGVTGAVGSKYDFSGYQDGNGQYHDTSGLWEFVVKGGLFFADEMDASQPNAVLFLNSLTANGICRFPHGQYERHENFRWVAAGNTWGNGATDQYVGRNPLDASSKDRVVIIPVHYDERLERSLQGDNEWVDYCQRARRSCETLEIQHIISMRAMADGLALMNQGLSRSKTEAYALWKDLERDQVAKIKKHMAGESVAPAAEAA